MKKNNKVVPLIKNLLIAAIVEFIIIAIIFIANEQQNDAIMLGIIVFGFLLAFYVSIKLINENRPYFFERKTNLLRISVSIISFMILVIIVSLSTIDKRSYEIGNIQIKFPKEKGFIYGDKDANNKYYYTHYYFNNCSIEIQRIYNNNEYSIFENIKSNIKLDNKITENIRLEDIYNSKFTERKEIINGKEWTINYTQVGTIKYTIYYIIIDDYIYQIGTANYNENPTICTNKINETFKTIKYKN